MPHKVAAFAGREEPQRDRDELHDLVEVARARGPQKRFQFRKRQFDRIEVRTVGWEKPETGADPFDRGLHLGLLVHRQVIEDHDVAGPQRRDEDLLDVGQKRRIVDWAVEDGRRAEPIDPQRSDHGVRLPMAIRGVITQPTSAWAATVATDEVGGDAGFIDEDVAPGVMERERVLPVPSRRCDVSSSLLVGEYRFF